MRPVHRVLVELVASRENKAFKVKLELRVHKVFEALEETKASRVLRVKSV